MNLKRNLKLLIVSSALVFLPGCALIDAYFIAKYDTNEYKIITEIRTLSEVSENQCVNSDISKQIFEGIYIKSVEFKNYTQYIPKNKDAHGLASNMIELAKQGKEQYDKGAVSVGFCKLKLQQINRTSEEIQKVIGSKPR
jgi:hypothetical protein